MMTPPGKSLQAMPQEPPQTSPARPSAPWSPDIKDFTTKMRKMQSNKKWQSITPKGPKDPIIRYFALV